MQATFTSRQEGNVFQTTKSKNKFPARMKAPGQEPVPARDPEAHGRLEEERMYPINDVTHSITDGITSHFTSRKNYELLHGKSIGLHRNA